MAWVCVSFELEAAQVGKRLELVGESLTRQKGSCSGFAMGRSRPAPRFLTSSFLPSMP